MKKTLVLALAAAACVLTVVPVRAGNLSWSIGIDAPLEYGSVGTVISNRPVNRVVYPPLYLPTYPPMYPPMYPPIYQVPPVIYEPPPTYYRPPPVVYRPMPRYGYGPAPVVVTRPVPIVYGGWVPPGPRKHWDSDRDGIPDRYDRHDNRKHRDLDDDDEDDHHDRHDGRKRHH